MIDKKSFEQAIPLASILASKGMSIVAVAGTPLEKLTSTTALLSTVSASVEVGDQASLGENDARDYQYSSDNEAHNSYFDQVVTLLSSSVSQHISNAKNVVSPLVLAASETIIERMKLEVETEPSYKVIVVGLPEPMKNDSFKEAVIKASGGIYADPEKYLRLTDKSPQEIQEMMLTGSNEFDEKIKLWFVSKGDVFFDRVWKNSFMDTIESNVSNPSTLMDSFKDKKDGTDYALAVYFLARRLMDDVPAETKMTLADYKRYVAQYLDAAAVKLAQEYQLNEATSQTGSLVLSHNEKKMEVMVYEDTYLNYIKNGGKNETIFGSLIENQIPFQISTLKDKEQDFKTSWDRYAMFSKATIQNKAFAKFKEITLSVLLSQLAEPTDIEKEMMLTNPGLLTDVGNQYNDYVNALGMVEMGDPYSVALKAIAKLRFHYTSAFSFLTSINDICKQNPNIDVREAALIATVEYVTDHQLDQMKLV